MENLLQMLLSVNEGSEYSCLSIRKFIEKATKEELEKAVYCLLHEFWDISQDQIFEILSDLSHYIILLRRDLLLDYSSILEKNGVDSRVLERQINHFSTNQKSVNK